MTAGEGRTLRQYPKGGNERTRASSPLVKSALEARIRWNTDNPSELSVIASEFKHDVFFHARGGCSHWIQYKRREASG